MVIKILKPPPQLPLFACGVGHCKFLCGGSTMSNLLEWFIPTIFVGLCFQSLFCNKVLRAFFKFKMTSLKKRELFL